MNLKQALNNIYNHMMWNDLFSGEVYEWIKVNYSDSIYRGEMYRCLHSDKIVKNDMLCSFSKDIESAINVVDGMRGRCRKEKQIILRQVYEGIDLIKLLRMWKTLYEFTSDEKHRIMKLINNFREEKEIVSRLHEYEIIK